MLRTWIALFAFVPVLWLSPLAFAAATTAEENAPSRDDCKNGKEADAQQCQRSKDAVRIISYEPSLLGWTYDQSGHGYMDFLLSVKFSVAPDWIRRWITPNSHVYFAFTGRSGQYFNRESSPVIGKRFNPELFYRHTLKGDAHFDAGYGHESNGQSINTLAGYQQAQTTLERPEYADDYISRGWDYVRLTVRSPRYPVFGNSDCVQAYLTGKRFLGGGVFQGKPEEYSSWENSPEGKPRDEVDGVSVLMKYVYDNGNDHAAGISGLKLALLYTTGYRDIFQNNSVRFEIGTKLFQLPLVLWTSRGYNSDLVRYYKNVKASGIAIEIGAF